MNKKELNDIMKNAQNNHKKYLEEIYLRYCDKITTKYCEKAARCGEHYCYAKITKKLNIEKVAETLETYFGLHTNIINDKKMLISWQ